MAGLLWEAAASIAHPVRPNNVAFGIVRTPSRHAAHHPRAAGEWPRGRKRSSRGPRVHETAQGIGPPWVFLCRTLHAVDLLDAAG
jgi:hypothetical protein